MRIELPGGGTLQLELPLPFLCVYRRTADRRDDGTEELVTAEKAHLIIPAEPRRASQAQQILRAVIEQLVGYFGSFLLIEIWSAPLHDHAEIIAAAERRRRCARAAVRNRGTCQPHSTPDH